ncbi:hypothetical protein ACFLUB_02090 [Chloroflexota bacterium]
MTSRSLIIRTRFKAGDYKIKRLSSAREKLAKLADNIEFNALTSDRIHDNWMPLRAVAEYLKDDEWIAYSESEIEKSRRSFLGSQHYEPEDALLMVLRVTMIEMKIGEKAVVGSDVSLSDIRNALKTEFDIHWENVQIQDACQALGFEIKSHSGYPRVKADVKKSQGFLKEHNI